MRSGPHIAVPLLRLRAVSTAPLFWHIPPTSAAATARRRNGDATPNGFKRSRIHFPRRRAHAQPAILQALALRGAYVLPKHRRAATRRWLARSRPTDRANSDAGSTQGPTSRICNYAICACSNVVENTAWGELHCVLCSPGGSLCRQHRMLPKHVFFVLRSSRTQPLQAVQLRGGADLGHSVTCHPTPTRRAA